MLKQFKEFMMRGNVLDLAVAVIMGGAFGKIVTSLVQDILMPVIGLVVGGINFSEQSFSVGEVVISWGTFLQAIIDFLMIAFVVFLIVKAANLRKEPAVPAEPSSKDCPFCHTSISIQATRCPNCTSQL